MGIIRDEIEKLWKAIPKNIYAPVPNDVAPALSYYVVYNSAISDVLSILDKWKLAAEYDAPVDVGLHIIGKCDNYADVGLSLDFEEGTHIAIYVRRGKDE